MNTVEENVRWKFSIQLKPRYPIKNIKEFHGYIEVRGDTIYLYDAALLREFKNYIKIGLSNNNYYDETINRRCITAIRDGNGDIIWKKIGFIVQ